MRPSKNAIGSSKMRYKRRFLKSIEKKLAPSARRKKPSSAPNSIPSSLYQQSIKEDDIALAFIDYVSKAKPFLKDFIVKIDNEGKTSWQLGKLKKRMGKIKGASDYFVAWPVVYHEVGKGSITIHGLWLELKTAEGEESHEQKAFGKRMRGQGYAYAVAHSIDEAIHVIDRYVEMDISRMVLFYDD